MHWVKMERGSALSILQRQGDISKILHRQRKIRGILWTTLYQSLW